MEYKKTIGEKELILRKPEESDAEAIIDYLKTVYGETRFLAKEPEEITFSAEDERNFIKRVNNSRTGIMLLGFLDGEMAGSCSLSDMGAMRFAHRAELSVALFRRFTGLGIGRFMVETLLKIAKETGLEQVTLEVAKENVRAVSLYKKLGFNVFGEFPKNMKYKDGTYSTTLWMMKEI